MEKASVQMATETGLFENWEHAVANVCGALSAEPMRDRPFRGILNKRCAGTIDIVEHDTELKRLKWTDKHIALARKEFCFLVIQREGRTRLFQNGVDVVLGPGDAVLVDSLRPVEFRYDENGVDQLSVHLPRAQLVQRLANRDVPCGHVFRANTGGGAVLTAYAQSLYSEAERLSTGQGAYCDSLIDLVVATLAGCDDGAGQSQQNRRIMAYLEQNLQDPDLSPRRAAMDLGLSIRHLHRLFSANGQSVADWIWRQRLVRAARDLGDPRYKNRSILEIAFDWGFNDASHFSRTFKAAYGISPRDHRRQAQSR